MPITKDLFLAILAMDACNRGAARQAEHEGHGQCVSV